jgi:signal transduction histidine kinase
MKPITMLYESEISLDNVGKYTERNGRITFNLGVEQDRAAVRIANTGQGIAAEDIPKIFDRFYRPYVSRSEETRGFGLGLSIAKAIVDRMDGEISAQSEDGLTAFTLRLRL